MQIHDLCFKHTCEQVSATLINITGAVFAQCAGAKSDGIITCPASQTHAMHPNSVVTVENIQVAATDAPAWQMMRLISAVVSVGMAWSHRMRHVTTVIVTMQMDAVVSAPSR